MTVSELIEELRKYPGHHPVLLETPYTDPENGAVGDDWNFVGCVRGQSNVGDTGPVVRIVAEDITHG